MTSLNRLVIAWSGPNVVGSAVSVLHYSASDNSAPPVAAVVTALQGIRPVMAGGVIATVPNTGDVIDDVTGTLTGVWSTTGGAAVAMTGYATGPAGVGACIGWQTGGIVYGKKLRGRTFMVPLSGDSYDSTGTLTANVLSVLGTFANAMQASGPLAVWSRPNPAKARVGNSYGVVSNRIRDKVAILTSRRD